MNFAEALDKTLDGGRITREEWGDEGIHGFMLNGVLNIRTGGKYQQWILHENDLLATDWKVV